MKPALLMVPLLQVFMPRSPAVLAILLLALQAVLCAAERPAKDAGQPAVAAGTASRTPMFPYQQSEQMAKELTAKGVKHEFILNPGAGHGLMAFNPNSNLKFNQMFDRLIAFADQHLK